MKIATKTNICLNMNTYIKGNSMRNYQPHRVFYFLILATSNVKMSNFNFYNIFFISEYYNLTTGHRQAMITQ